jgi:hypothetical protein
MGREGKGGDREVIDAYLRMGREGGDREVRDALSNYINNYMDLRLIAVLNSTNPEDTLHTLQ